MLIYLYRASGVDYRSASTRTIDGGLPLFHRCDAGERIVVECADVVYLLQPHDSIVWRASSQILIMIDLRANGRQKWLRNGEVEMSRE